MALTLVTAASAPLVSLVEAKRHCRVDHDDDDAFLTSLLDVVSENIDGADGAYGRSFRLATWKLSLPCFPHGKIRLPLPPLREVTEVAYTDEDGNSQTYSAFREFGVLAKHAQGIVLPAYDDDWPDTRDDTPEAVRVTFEAGYDDVPAPVKHAALLMIGHLYENREEVTEIRMEQMPVAATRLLAPFESWATH